MRLPDSFDAAAPTLNARPTARTAPVGSGPGAPIFELGTHTRIRRAPVRAIAALHWEGGPAQCFGQVDNVSPGGCLLVTEATIPPNATLSMRITIVGGGQPPRVFAIAGRALRRTERDGRRAYGVEFVREDADSRAAERLYGAASA